MLALRWRRNHSGSYRLGTQARFTKNGEVRFRTVYILVEHYPEWPRPNQWAVTVMIADNSDLHGTEVVGLSDIVTATCRDAKATVEKMLIHGFQWHDGFGWCDGSSNQSATT